MNALERMNTLVAAGKIEVTISGGAGARQITLRRAGIPIVGSGETVGDAAESAIGSALEMWPDLADVQAPTPEPADAPVIDIDATQEPEPAVSPDQTTLDVDPDAAGGEEPDDEGEPGEEVTGDGSGEALPDHDPDAGEQAAADAPDVPPLEPVPPAQATSPDPEDEPADG